MAEQSYDFIENEQLENVKVKWPFSNFDGREKAFAREGDHSFVIILDEKEAEDLRNKGWNVKTRPPYEEGDPDEHTLEIKISYRFGDGPRFFLIKRNRKVRGTRADLGDIKRDTLQELDVVIRPSKWKDGSGVTAYANELYAVVKTSRFEEKYADYEEAGALREESTNE